MGDEYPCVDDIEKTSNFTCFTSDGTGTFYPAVKTAPALPSGYYNISIDNEGKIYFQSIQPQLDKLVVLESSEMETRILNDMRTFWKSRKKYEDRGKVYKRNILLYSKPGIGKTSLLNIMVRDLLASGQEVTVLLLSMAYHVQTFRKAVGYLRDVMPERPIIAIIEDIDNFAGTHAFSKEVESELLNILDGNYKFDNMVILATTNYPQYLTERFISRPSRFNRRFELPLPNAATRREFLTKTNLPEDLERVDVDKWVERTEGYTIDFLKELSDAVFISERDEDSVFKELDDMQQISVVKVEESSKIGLI